MEIDLRTTIYTSENLKNCIEIVVFGHVVNRVSFAKTQGLTPSQFNIQEPKK